MGSKLAGTYIGVSFAGHDLYDTNLIGEFVDCDFTDALINDNTRFLGTFVNCIGLPDHIEGVKIG